MLSEACPECEKVSTTADLSGKHITLIGTLADTPMKGLLSSGFIQKVSLGIREHRALCKLPNKEYSDSDMPELNNLWLIDEK